MLNNREYIINQAKEIESLKDELERKDLKIAELNIKLCVLEGKLNKYMNYIKMVDGREEI